MANNRFDVVNGPSLEMLFDALRLIAEKRSVEVSWITPIGTLVLSRIILNRLQTEDGSGDKWLATGYELDGVEHVQFYINTKDRTGWIEFNK